MADIGTYGSGYSPFVFDKVLPDFNDMITFDWMESISQFSQRFIKIATSTVTIGNGSTYNFNYSSLQCDFFPPFICAYTQDPVTGWREFNLTLGHNQNQYVEILNIGLGTCDIVNNTGASKTFHCISYS